MFDWMMRYSKEISWFVIGLCTLSTVTNLAAGNYGWAAFNAFLAVVNFYMVRR